MDEKTGASLILFESEQAAREAAERLRTNPAPTVRAISIEVAEVVEHT